MNNHFLLSALKRLGVYCLDWHCWWLDLCTVAQNSSDRSLNLYACLCVLFLISDYKKSCKMLKRDKKDGKKKRKMKKKKKKYIECRKSSNSSKLRNITRHFLLPNST